MLYVDKDNAHPPSIEIAKAKRVLKNTDGVEVCYDSLGQLQEASQLIPHLWDSLGADQGTIFLVIRTTRDTKRQDDMARRRSCLTLNIRRLILTVTLWIIAICLPYAMENIRKTKRRQPETDIVPRIVRRMRKAAAPR